MTNGDHQPALSEGTVGGSRPVNVVSIGQVPACPRCGGEGLLLARVPHHIDRPDGHRIHGKGEVVLCPSCDADHPSGGPLITFFHVHGTVDEGTVAQAADLIAAWAASVRVTSPNLELLDEEAEAWHRGDL